MATEATTVSRYRNAAGPIDPAKIKYMRYGIIVKTPMIKDVDSLIIPCNV
jgi:hypothetical protein